MTAAVLSRAPDETALASLLGRTSPLAKLAVAVLWLVGLAFAVDPVPPVVLSIAAAVAGAAIGGVPPQRLIRAVAPLWVAAVAIGLSNAVFSQVNGSGAPFIVSVGPIRMTADAAANGLALGLRVLAIATVGALFALTTDSTRLVDALVQQARVPERFGYGALAAYQAVPHLAQSLTTLREARRIRGLGGGWHPRILIGLLVLAIRHADRLALAMDARAFGTVRRSRYRPIHWAPIDAVVMGAGLVILVVALLLGAAF